MKKMTIFYFPECPHCVNAFRWQEELYLEHPEYRDIEIQMVDEHADPVYADLFEYYYVPTYYIDGVKLHEGVTKRELVEEAFKTAFEA